MRNHLINVLKCVDVCRISCLETFCKKIREKLQKKTTGGATTLLGVDVLSWWQVNSTAWLSWWPRHEIVSVTLHYRRCLNEARVTESRFTEASSVISCPWFWACLRLNTVLWRGILISDNIRLSTLGSIYEQTWVSWDQGAIVISGRSCWAGLIRT